MSPSPKHQPQNPLADAPEATSKPSQSSGVTGATSGETSGATSGGESGGKLAGTSADLDSAEERRQALEQAFDYRGDVTLTTTDGRTLAGYLYDRDQEADPPVVRVMLKDGGREKIAYDQVARVEYDKRDPAAGKSWETWVKKYVEKKTRGERASIESEPLE